MKKKLFLLSFLCLSIAGWAQKEITISGTVLDSATFQTLPYVAIQIKGKSIGQSTAENGTFAIACAPSDTLVFTRLGYRAFFLRATRDMAKLRIIMAEDARLLKDVVVYDDVTIEGVDDWKKSLPANTKVKIKEQHLEPGTNEVATFGPGITIGLGGGKDKSKPKRDELSRTEVYRQTISSPEVKKQLMDLYGITEAQYIKKLERFNKRYPDAVYLTNQEEIVNMMIQSFAMKD